MERNTFLKGLGAIGVGSMLPLHKAVAALNTEAPLPAPPLCLLTPAVPEGPFYLNANLVRQDITEGFEGIPVHMTFTVVNADCVPIPNAIVDIWHCDKEGTYSGFGSQGTAGQTFLRGMQMTDVNGQCQFTSIYPGWYPGRLTHLHVKIHFDNSTYVTTNLFYPSAVNQVVYADPLYATNGQNPVTIAQDIELSGDTARFNNLLSTFADDGNGGYLQSYTFGINVVNVGTPELDPITGGQFMLKQNFPNPFPASTTITFTLRSSSNVLLEVFNTQGALVKQLLNERSGAGEHKVDWDGTSDGSRVAPGSYLFQLSVTNAAGTFRQSKVMTVN